MLTIFDLNDIASNFHSGIQNLKNKVTDFVGGADWGNALNGYYSSKPRFTNGLTVRDWLAGKSFEEQYQFGIDKLREFGII